MTIRARITLILGIVVLGLIVALFTGSQLSASNNIAQAPTEFPNSPIGTGETGLHFRTLEGPVGDPAQPNTEPILSITESWMLLEDGLGIRYYTRVTTTEGVLLNEGSFDSETGIRYNYWPATDTLWIEEGSVPESNFWKPNELNDHLSKRELHSAGTEHRPQGDALIYEHAENLPDRGGRLVVREFVDQATGLNLGFSYVTTLRGVQDTFEFRITEWEWIDPSELPQSVFTWVPPDAAEIYVMDGSPTLSGEANNAHTLTTDMATPTPLPTIP